MTVKLFQDAGGTIPAVLAGQPVGFIKRTKGSDDAKQATALSKPTYARHPKTGVRNLMHGAQAVSSAAQWLDSAVTNGVTATKVASGIEGGIPYVDYRFTGTATNNTAGTFFVRNFSQISRVSGRKTSIRATVRRISGEFPSTPVVNRGMRVEVVEVASAGGYIIGSGASPSMSATDTEVSMVYVETANEAATQTRPGITLACATGDELDVTYRIKGLQWELGEVPSPLQFNYGPNDITERGVPDLWHLYNDGGDSLNVTLPAGTYGLASIGIDRQIIVTTFVSDGTTPVNILRHERQLDVCYRLGAYSAAEEVAIRDAWGRKYA